MKNTNTFDVIRRDYLDMQCASIRIEAGKVARNGVMAGRARTVGDNKTAIKFQAWSNDAKASLSLHINNYLKAL